MKTCLQLKIAWIKVGVNLKISLCHAESYLSILTTEHMYLLGLFC